MHRRIRNNVSIDDGIADMFIRLDTDEPNNRRRLPAVVPIDPPPQRPPRVESPDLPQPANDEPIGPEEMEQMAQFLDYMMLRGDLAEIDPELEQRVWAIQRRRHREGLPAVLPEHVGRVLEQPPQPPQVSRPVIGLDAARPLIIDAIRPNDQRRRNPGLIDQFGRQPERERAAAPVLRAAAPPSRNIDPVPDNAWRRPDPGAVGLDPRLEQERPAAPVPPPIQDNGDVSLPHPELNRAVGHERFLRSIQPSSASGDGPPIVIPIAVRAAAAVPRLPAVDWVVRALESIQQPPMLHWPNRFDGIRRPPARDEERIIVDPVAILNSRRQDVRSIVVPQRRLAVPPAPPLLLRAASNGLRAQQPRQLANRQLVPLPHIIPPPERPAQPPPPAAPPARVGLPPVDWLPRRRVALPRLGRLAPNRPRLACRIAPATMPASQIAVRTSCNQVMLLDLKLAEQEFGLFRRLIAFAPISSREVYHVPLERKQLLMCLAWTKRHKRDCSEKEQLGDANDSGMLEDPCAHDNFERANENLYECRLLDLCSFIYIAHTMDSEKMMAEAMRAFEFRYAKREPWKAELRWPRGTFTSM